MQPIENDKIPGNETNSAVVTTKKFSELISKILEKYLSLNDLDPKKLKFYSEFLDTNVSEFNSILEDPELDLMKAVFSFSPAIKFSFFSPEKEKSLTITIQSNPCVVWKQ